MPDKTVTTERQRCKAKVLKRDQYRRTGRGKTGLEMHYNEKQCSRYATCPDGYCRQHARIMP